MTGRRLDRLPVAAGQFFVWRFLDAPGWTRGHPYSLSAAPTGDTLRITVKDLGDASRGIAHVRPGTRVAIEGPYGRLHDGVRTRRKVLLLAGGIGVTPLRGLLEALPQDAGDVTLVYRASHEGDLILRTRSRRWPALAAPGSSTRSALGSPDRHSWLPEAAGAPVRRGRAAPTGTRRRRPRRLRLRCGRLDGRGRTRPPRGRGPRRRDPSRAVQLVRGTGMRRIAIAIMGTISGLVLLFSYHTSRNEGSVAVATSAPAVAGLVGLLGSSGSGSSGSSGPRGRRARRPRRRPPREPPLPAPTPATPS